MCQAKHEAAFCASGTCPNENGTRLNGFVSEVSDLAEITYHLIQRFNCSWQMEALCEVYRKIGSNFKGIYKSSWTDDKGDEHSLAVTQFCATDARRRFSPVLTNRQ